MMKKSCAALILTLVMAISFAAIPTQNGGNQPALRQSMVKAPKSWSMRSSR